MTDQNEGGTTERADYSGAFDPGFDYEDLSKEALVRLVREYGLIVHLLDRSMCAAIGLKYGADAVKELAIEEWAGASPVYGDRLRRIMQVEGDGVSAIFKVLQLDPGFPHHYMDVHYELVDETHGYFELAYCGALMDAEPFGDAMVTNMCHHIEDGTFDVTAQAVNPKAHIRHVHRPPRVPGDRVPHCRWEIVIEDETETLPAKDITKITRMTTAATFAFPDMKDGTPHIPVGPGVGAQAESRRDAGRMTMFDTVDTGPDDAAAEQPGRRHLSERQAEVMERLVAAAAEEADVSSYGDISVRTIAKRAGVAPATAYTYFSGKDHLLAEVLWRRVQASPLLVDLTLPLPDRVADTVRTMGFGAMGSPGVTVCTTALLGDGPDVKRVRSRLGAEIGRRLETALAGAGGPPVLNVLQVTYNGALLSAGMGHLAFDAVPRLMAEATALMTGGADALAGSGRVVTTVAPLAYSPYDYVIHEDPYPTYARLRAEAPVFYNEELDFFAYARHADVLAAFRDVDHYSNTFGVSLDPAAFGPDAHRAMSFLAMDPPRHTRMRSIVGKSFTPRRVAAMEDGIRALTRSHMEPALQAGSFDFIADFAGLLPMDVISELVGVPVSDRVEIRRLADLLMHREDGMTDIPAEGLEAALTLAGYYGDMVADRRQHERDDLTWSLLQAEIDGDRLTDDEVIGFLFLLVVAGNETTTKLLGNAWYWGWRNPDQLAKPLANPTRVPDWVEETLRYDTSTQMLVRVTSQPVRVQGVDIEAGRRVLLLLGSANRDEDVFPDPETYDLERRTQDLVSFGSGRHFCMGAALARMEARVALTELAGLVRSYEIEPAAIERVHSINVRGFAALPTTVTVR